jgi:CheY-like chemotaxis protein
MQPKRILVVDGEAMNLKIIRAILEGPDNQLDLAENGGIGWARLRDETRAYDLVILDRLMPVMDGITLLQRLKADPRYRAVPVIMQTAAATPEQVAEGLAAGAYFYLTKPYEPDALLTIVRAALEVHGLSDARARSLRECRAMYPLLENAEFQFRQVDEADVLAAQLAQFCPSPDTALLGLGELLVNAVEHGNLEISYAEKTCLKWEDAWDEEIAHRLSLPRYRERRASVRIEKRSDEMVFTIRDAGPGFDWRAYLEFSPERAYDPNGRGIAMARKLSFSSLEYQGNGNTVVARIARG